jgi:hypothetical protein
MYKLLIQSAITVVLTNSVITMANAQANELTTKLPSGVYYAAGTMNNNSRREVLNVRGKVCLKIVDGSPNNYRGQEKVTISTISEQAGKLFIDATNQEIIPYTGAEARQRYRFVQDTTQFAFAMGRREPWEYRGNRPDPRTTPEQNQKMRDCINSPRQYVHNMQGNTIRGRF